MKWLIRLLIKPVIKPIKKAIELCDKLLALLDKLVAVVNGLPLEQAFKDQIITDINSVKNAVISVKTVLVKVLEIAGEDIPSNQADDGETVEAKIEAIKKLL